ncbi:Protein STU1 [Grifola frondosa]|uniref:Protein STU1 n=1 Tax=Grifola frondosa TaxID=5627 RepID=A0A1C7MHY2_GRIFR|nr:Protein STU1 [Grifola frondosa]
MDDSSVRRLINQCKTNDIDAKVDAIAKLQAEFEAGTEIPDPDALIAVFKTCLRTPNQHLTTATLSALPPLLPLLITRTPRPLPSASPPHPPPPSRVLSIDAHTLRQVLQAFLPAGGVLDRLGDSRERAREKARETLVILGGLRSAAAARAPCWAGRARGRARRRLSCVARTRTGCSDPGAYTPGAPPLPIRPYLPALVEALEDTDGTVRECARVSVVELFTGPGVTDAARADLKKELTKKGVRKTIVDGVLSRYWRAYCADEAETGAAVGSSSGGTVSRTTSHGNVKDMSRPSSRTAVTSPVPADGAGSAGGGGSDVKPVYIASSRDLENEFASMLKHFEGRESEHNWLGRDNAIQRVRGMLKGEVHERYTETFLHGLKNGSWMRLSKLSLVCGRR